MKCRLFAVLSLLVFFSNIVVASTHANFSEKIQWLQDCGIQVSPFVINRMPAVTQDDYVLFLDQLTKNLANCNSFGFSEIKLFIDKENRFTSDSRNYFGPDILIRGPRTFKVGHKSAKDFAEYLKLNESRWVLLKEQALVEIISACGIDVERDLTPYRVTVTNPPLSRVQYLAVLIKFVDELGHNCSAYQRDEEIPVSVVFYSGFHFNNFNYFKMKFQDNLNGKIKLVPAKIHDLVPYLKAYY